MIQHSTVGTITQDSDTEWLFTKRLYSAVFSRQRAQTRITQLYM